jgi:histidinol phosphatase-like enzyme
MNIIFLDIDGVLNTERYIVYQVKNKIADGYEAQFNFDPRAMSNLREIINKTSAKIVISSTWRIFKDDKTDEFWNAILDNFAKYYIPAEIIGVTPVLHTERGNEIRKWLEDNQNLNIENFVIIDDDSDMCEFTETHLAKCSWKNGLDEIAKNKALEILKIN